MSTGSLSKSQNLGYSFQITLKIVAETTECSFILYMDILKCQNLTIKLFHSRIIEAPQDFRHPRHHCRCCQLSGYLKCHDGCWIKLELKHHEK